MKVIRVRPNGSIPYAKNYSFSQRCSDTFLNPFFILLAFAKMLNVKERITQTRLLNQDIRDVLR